MAEQERTNTVPILVALIGFAGVAWSAVWTAWSNNHEIEVQRLKYQQDLVLEAMRTGDPDQAAENLRFLLDAGFLTENASAIREYLTKRPPKTGRALPPR
jgi:hypothetical protein